VLGLTVDVVVVRVKGLIGGTGVVNIVTGWEFWVRKVSNCWVVLLDACEAVEGERAGVGILELRKFHNVCC